MTFEKRVHSLAPILEAAIETFCPRVSMRVPRNRKSCDRSSTVVPSRRIVIAFIVLLSPVSSPSQTLSDVVIQQSIDRGAATTAKRLWDEITRHQQVRINRAGFGDPIEKKVTFLSDVDRIALEAAETKRELRDLTVIDVRRTLPLGLTEVMLEANCYNNLYAGGLLAWGPEAGVHLVLKVDGVIVQPLGKRAGVADSVTILPQEHGLIAAQGPLLTYTPLYRSAIYERESQRSWFDFPALRVSAKSLSVVVISANGKTKEKKIENSLR